MSVDLEAVNAREKGQFPVSIGTSLALEGASGIHPDRPVTPAPFEDPPQQLWFNVRTLFRNLHGAIASDVRGEVLPPALHTALVEELTILEAVVAKQTEGRTSAVFYACDYTSLGRKFPKAQLKTASTPNQRAYAGLEQQTLRLLMREHGSQDLRHFEMELQGKHGHCWLVSHLPVDLLSQSHFTSLKLLESHTGLVKGPALWYTKYTTKDLANIPFGAFALQVFGDGGHHFVQMPRVIREAVLELADKYQWNLTTTRDRMMLSIRSIPDPMTRSFLLALL